MTKGALSPAPMGANRLWPVHVVGNIKHWYPVLYHGYISVKINEKPVACAACLQAGRKSQLKKLLVRKPLCELSVNTIKRSRSTKEFK